jgi:murein tripeptide amidase MpaA
MTTALRVLLLILAISGLAACDSTTAPSTTLVEAEITTDFEGASLESWGQLSPGVFHLRIRRDTNSEFARWYSFRVLDGQGDDLTFRVVNAGQVSAASAFSFNRPAVSEDGGGSWSRIQGPSYDAGVFSFSYTPTSSDTWIALGPVYNFSRVTDLMEEIRDHSMVDSLTIITQTLQGRPLHLIKITDPAVHDSLKGAVWAIGRQHPAEVGGSWMAEGLLRWLLTDEPQVRDLRRQAVFYLVPFMNPDGVALGNYRVNSVGANLNREWASLDPERAPTVAAVAHRIESFASSDRRFEFFVDFHAYSSLRKNFFFFSGLDRAPQEQVQEIETLMVRFEEINGDFTRAGSDPSSDDTRLARGWAFETFGVQAVTFECSYQDVTYGPFAGEYMTPARYLALGEGLGKSVAEVLFGIPPSG